MSEDAQPVSQAATVIFGWDPFWVSTILFVLSYVAIITERINRAVVALIGAGAMILVGVLNQEAAIHGVDFNTIGLLTGMMVIVAVTRKSGVFQFVAVWSAQFVNARPWGILVMLSIATALFSAVLDNVTTVLLIAPVTLVITEELDIQPFPFLFAEIFASNIGGTATLIGDPPNIMIGSAVNLSFMDFLVNIGPITPLILVLTLATIYLIWGRSMYASDEARQRVMSYDAHEAITDKRLLKTSMFVLALVLLGFINGHNLHLEPATIAMSGAALLLLLTTFMQDSEEQSESIHRSFGEVEWVTIFFFVGLFVLVHGIERAGVLNFLGNRILTLTEGDMTVTALAIVWMSAVVSALVDNIPFVATMIPMIKSMAPTFGGAEQLMPLWWSLALGACLGGNGTLIGASANLIVAGFAERAGYRIKFLTFMAFGFPLMLATIAISSVYIYFVFL